MALSKVEQILQAIVATITPTSGISSKVFRDRWEAVARNEMPCLVVEPLGEEPVKVSICFTDYILTVAVDILISGSPLSELADPIRVDLHSRLMANRQLGGLAHLITPGPSEWMGESGEIGILALRYRVPFRTQVADLTQ